MQHRHRAFRLDRLAARTDRVLPRHLLGAGDDIAQARAGDGLCIEVDQIAELRHQLRHAPGMMEMLHVMLTRGLEVDQHRHLAAEPVESFEIDAMLGAVGDRGQMNKPVGRSADRLQHHLCISERSPGQQFTRPRPFRDGHGRGVCRPKPLGVRCRYRRAHRQRQAESFGDAGHGGGSAHHHAGAHGRRKAPVDRLDLDIVDFAGAIFGP